MQHKPDWPVVSHAQPLDDEASSGRFGLLGRIVGYGFSRTTVEALLAGRGLMLAGILGPEMFGIWALFRIALRYLAFAGLGMLRGLEFEVSRSSGRQQGDPVERTVWGRIGAGHTLLLYGTLSALIAAIWAWRGEHVAGIALLGVALGLLPDRLWSYGLTFLRASGGVRRYAVVELLNAIFQVSLCVALALYWGLTGAFAGFAIANLVSIGMLLSRAPLTPRFEWRRVYRLIRIGFPVSLMGILTATLATADRLLVGAFLGLGGLGLYAFAVSISELGVSFAAVVRTVILRDVYDRSQISQKQETPFVVNHALSGFATFGPLLAGSFALLLPLLIAFFADEFSSAASVAQLLLFAGLIQGFNNVAVLGVVADGLQSRLPVVSVAAVCLNVVLTLSVISMGLGLQGVAAAAFLTRLIQAGAILVLLLRGSRIASVAAMVSRLLLPTVWCVVAVYTIGRLLPSVDFRTLILQLLCYIVALAVLVPAVARELRARPGYNEETP